MFPIKGVRFNSAALSTKVPVDSLAYLFQKQGLLLLTLSSHLSLSVCFFVFFQGDKLSGWVSWSAVELVQSGSVVCKSAPSEKSAYRGGHRACCASYSDDSAVVWIHGSFRASKITVDFSVLPLLYFK